MTQTKFKNKFVVDFAYPTINSKMSNSIVNSVNVMNNSVNVHEIDGFENFFLVRKGVHSEILRKEEEQGLISAFGYLILRAIEKPSKKIYFSVWKKIKNSEVLF